MTLIIVLLLVFGYLLIATGHLTGVNKSAIAKSTGLPVRTPSQQYKGFIAEEYFKHHPRFVRRWLTRADCVIVLSGFLEHIFQQYSIPCMVIPNMIELKEIKRTSVFNPQAPSFISVRSLDETYNIPCILRAFKLVQQEIPGASLTVLGSGPLKNELIRYVEDNKIQHVQFVGQVTNRDIYSYLAKHDVLLSAPKIDNMPMSLLEAMNAGTLVISSNVGGVPYMIKDGTTGLLYDYDDDKALAKHMIWATKNIEKVQEITSVAHQEVQRYCWANVRKLLLPLYD